MKFTKQPATTIIDVLFALFLSLTCAILIASAFRYAKFLTTKLDQTAEQEWSIFLIQLEHQTLYAKNVRIEGAILKFDGLEDSFSVNTPIKDQVYKSVALKRGNEGWLNYSINGGTNIVLTRVTHCSYQQFPNYLKLFVEFSDGKKRTGVVSLGFN
ncbi:ComGF family competence protein [uncultured Enterococcus sp.]|uniref:ComGF family competence protein n=1 Tax=uncultured Enterococcus sp. TaxID=167972 RepID=UPI0025F74BB8|nr:ComGF family competence protein [uncultured Enterococcus sp.]